MAGRFVRVRATRWVSDEPIPGLIEVELVDADSRTWRFQDKTPIFDVMLTAASTYPVDLEIACTVLDAPDELGEGRVRISTAEPWGIESVDGQWEFVVRADQLSPDRGDAG